jgi:hypothetical protein
VFNSTIKDIHLTLEVKTFFGSSTSVTGPVWNPGLRSLNFPLTAINGIVGREREETCTPKSYKAKLERLRSARLTHRDQVVTLLDMQRLQAIKTF